MRNHVIFFSVALSFGLKESVMLNNVLTSVNITLVVFFVIVGLTKGEPSKKLFFLIKFFIGLLIFIL